MYRTSLSTTEYITRKITQCSTFVLFCAVKIHNDGFDLRLTNESKMTVAWLTRTLWER